MVEPTAENENPETNVGEEPKQFTQTEVNDMMQKRLAREATARQKAIEEAIAEDRKKREIESLQGEERIKAEYESKLAESQRVQDENAKKYAELERELAVTKAQAQLSSLGLPAELAPNVIGSDDKETAKNIAALSKAVNDLVAKKVNEGLNHGAPRAVGDKTGPKSDMETEFRRLMGIPKE